MDDNKPKRFMIKPAEWAIEALAAEVEKHPTVEWRDVANFIFEVGCRALGYGGDEDEADNASAESNPLALLLEARRRCNVTDFERALAELAAGAWQRPGNRL